MITSDKKPLREYKFEADELLGGSEETHLRSAKREGIWETSVQYGAKVVRSW